MTKYQRCAVVAVPIVFFLVFIFYCDVWLNHSRGNVPQFSLSADELLASFERADLQTENDVQVVVSNAAGSERAIMFINVDWSPLWMQEKRYAEFILDYQRMHPKAPIQFHYVDCTSVTQGYVPLCSLPGWKELEQKAGTSLIHGWGEVVWMENGRVLHVEAILNFDSASELVHKTEALMSIPQKTD